MNPSLFPTPPATRSLLCTAFTATALLPFLVSLITPVAAQKNTAAIESETVVLSPFAVEARQDLGRYQATQSTSGTRVRMDLMDFTQSVSVVTRDLIEDIGTGKVLDAAKYISGITEGTAPNAIDRMNIRGFSRDGPTVDGFSNWAYSQLDPAIIDRIEVVKGPNAIIAPQGNPGGTLNNVTKKPFFTTAGTSGYVSHMVGRYAADRSELDINHVLNDKIALRLVGAFHDADDYGRGNKHQTTTVMPMITYRFNANNDITLQFRANNWTNVNHNAQAVNVYASSTGGVRLVDGMPRDMIAQGDNVTRHTNSQYTRFFYNSILTDRLSMRVAANWVEASEKVGHLNISAPNISVIAVDPATGMWVWDGVTRNDDPTYTLAGDVEFATRNYVNFQHDFVYTYDTTGWKSSTVAGYAINWEGTYVPGIYNMILPPEYTAGIRFRPGYEPPPYTLQTNPRAAREERFRSQQAYLFQTVSLLDEKLHLSASLSFNRYFMNNFNLVNGVRLTNDPNTLLPAGGVVYKITPDFALYYGYSKQERGISPNTTSPQPIDKQGAEQHEYGIRVRTFEGRLYFTLVYFDIEQSNVTVPDFRNWIAPIPDPPFPPSYANRTAEGFEIEFTWAPTKQFSVIGNATKFKNRDSDWMTYNNSPEESAAIWASYAFDEASALKGLRIGIGADYTGRRAGNTSPEYTSLSTPENRIRVQPSFWLPGRTLVNASASYAFGQHWKAQLNIDNLFNDDYVMASAGRTIWVGIPINTKFTLTYSF